MQVEEIQAQIVQLDSELKNKERVTEWVLIVIRDVIKMTHNLDSKSLQCILDIISVIDEHVDFDFSTRIDLLSRLMVFNGQNGH